MDLTATSPILSTAISSISKRALDSELFYRCDIHDEMIDYVTFSQADCILNGLRHRRDAGADRRQIRDSSLVSHRGFMIRYAISRCTI